MEELATQKLASMDLPALVLQDGRVIHVMKVGLRIFFALLKWMIKTQSIFCAQVRTYVNWGQGTSAPPPPKIIVPQQKHLCLMRNKLTNESMCPHEKLPPHENA